jgi:hypothetical protein
MVAASLGILTYVAPSLVHNWGTTDKGGLLRQLALPVWLTVGTLPFVYALGLLETYRSTSPSFNLMVCRPARSLMGRVLPSSTRMVRSLSRPMDIPASKSTLGRACPDGRSFGSSGPFA